jgi:iron-sulfur cluster assembly accessory protein
MDGTNTIVDGIGVTDAAFSQLSDILRSEGESKFLRVAVLGGGCSGFQYTFDLDETVAADDVVIEKGGIRVAIDSVSQPFLDGAVIDFKDELIGAHFAIDNPNATSSCGCGTSFSI